MFIYRLVNALESHKIPYAIVGGYAVALHGALRGTIDIDFVIKWQQNNLLQAEKALKSIGLISRLPIDAEDVFNFRDEYIEKRNLIAWSFHNPSHNDEQVDLLINFDLGKKKVLTAKLREAKIHYLNKKDLIAMKKQSGRQQDLADIDALEKLK
jgi:hypothetical protein